MPRTPQTPTRPLLVETRDTLIQTLDSTTQALVMLPNPENGEATWLAMNDLAVCATKFILACSTSSNPAYAEQDLPVPIGDAWRRGKHLTQVLGQLYGPKAVDA